MKLIPNEKALLLRQQKLEQMASVLSRSRSAIITIKYLVRYIADSTLPPH